MLKKSAIVVLYPKEDQFLSSLFLVKRKDGGGEEGWGVGGITHYPKKSAIVVLYPEQDQFLSSLFLVKRKDRGGGEGGGNHPLPKRPEQQYSVSALQDGSVVPIKENVTRG